MGIGTTNLASTPCCGLITRSWSCELVNGEWVHSPGGKYAPQRWPENYQLDTGTCPDCGQSFVDWLNSEQEAGYARSFVDEWGETRWRWDYHRAQSEWLRQRKEYDKERDVLYGEEYLARIND